MTKSVRREQKVEEKREKDGEILNEREEDGVYFGVFLK